MVSLLDTLQAAVAVEHQAVYGYGVVGARQVGRARADAASCLLRHQALRDRLTQTIASQGGVPVAPEAAYALPTPVNSSRSAASLAVHLEDASSGASWDVLSVTSPADAVTRQLCIRALAASADWSSRWREATGEPALPPFPGQPG